MDDFTSAVELIRPHLAAVELEFVAAGIVIHLSKLAARTQAWRNIIAAAYPDAEVRRRAVFGAYAAGLAVNSVVPARSGELVRLWLVRREIPGATYPTLVVTLFVEMLFNSLVAFGLVVWAARAGALPLPDGDSSIILGGVAAALVIGVGITVLWRRRGRWATLGRGAAVLEDRRAYASRVACWQAADWLLRLATVACFLEAFDAGGGWRLVLIVQAVQSASTIVPFAPLRLGMRQALLGTALVAQAPLAGVLLFTLGMEVALGAVNMALGFGALTLMLGTVRWRRAVAAVPA